jgi:hypothetical protein
MDAFLRPIITPNEICFRDLAWVYSLPIALLQLEHRDCDLDLSFNCVEMIRNDGHEPENFLVSNHFSRDQKRFKNPPMSHGENLIHRRINPARL